MSLWAWIAKKKNRADLADVAWGGGMLVISWTAFFVSMSLPVFILNLCISIWAVRLIVHIYLRNNKKQEDFRYQKLKKDWKTEQKWIHYFKIFGLQGAILYFISAPILWFQFHVQSISLGLFSSSLTLWAFGFIIEAISDYQLTSFQKTNKGKLLQSGLWKYSRHPNYLGEIIQWWAVWTLVIPLPWGWLFILSPILITYLIHSVSGIAPIEKKMQIYPEFEEYCKKTPKWGPLSWSNGLIYSFSWYAMVLSGAKGNTSLALLIGLISYTVELIFLKSSHRDLFYQAIPFSIYFLCLGFFQEMLLIHTSTVVYPGQHFLIPLWVWMLYPLFSILFYSNLFFLKKYVLLTISVGGCLACLSYFTAEQLGALRLQSNIWIPVIFFTWAFSLLLLLLLQKKLTNLFYLIEKSKNEKITVFFDGLCPICSAEMKALKQRKQTGPVEYVTLTSKEDLAQYNSGISYENAMKQIHAIDERGNVLKGVDVLSALYARTDYSGLALLLLSPGLTFVFRSGYAIWTVIRPLFKP
jgi:steroid 5-alpha reductase family enzyme/predicted DCC family thiol-disulfide oxidoreductase YuxK